MHRDIKTFVALQKYRDFRYLWVSTLFFFGGNWMQLLLMGWLAYEITGSQFLLALFAAARLLPMVLGPVGGLVADRLDRIRFLIYLLLLNLLITVVLVILVSTGSLEFWHLVLAGLLLGLTHSPAQPARHTLVMDIVGEGDVTNAVSLNTIGMDVSRVAGPALGGVLLAQLGPTLSLAISGLWFVIAVVTLLPILYVGRHRIRGELGSPLRDLFDGFRIVLGNRNMATVLSISLLCNLFVWPVFQAFMPVFAKDVLHVGPAGLGFLLTAMGLGALLGAICVASLGDFKWKGQLYIWGSGAFGLFFALFGLSNWFSVSLVLIGLAGFASSAFGVMQATLMLILAPPALRGRAMGMQTLAIGISPLATTLQGAIATIIGVPLTTALASSSLALIMVAFFIWAPSLRRMR